MNQKTADEAVFLFMRCHPEQSERSLTQLHRLHEVTLYTEIFLRFKNHLVRKYAATKVRTIKARKNPIIV